MRNDMAKGCDIKGTSNKRLVPGLRFPEFEKDGEWEEKKLGEIANIINEKCKVKDLKIETYISTENILKDYAGITQIAKLPQTGSFTLFSKGDILVANIRPYLKKIWIADFDGAASNDVIVFRSNENINNSYVSHLIKNDEFVNYCMAGAKGVKMPRGDKEMMINYSVPKPSSTDEQQKIAECLSSIDEEISAIKEKAEQLKIHKKGLMQKLFPVAGKFVPEVRFPEFKKEWGKNVLKTIIKTITPPKKLQTTEYHKKGMFPIIDQSQSFICGFSDDESALVNKKKEDVVIFGDHTCILKLANFTFIQGADGIKIFKSSDPDIVRTDYIYHYLNAFPIGIKEYKRHYSELKEIIVCYSDSIIEQQKIAECLSSIDELISLYENKVTLLEQHKKGLMQQLFPKS